MARPVPGKWSTLEVICHLADFDPILADRIKRILAEDRPQLLGADEKRFAAALAYQERDPEEELALIAQTRSQLAHPASAEGRDPPACRRPQRTRRVDAGANAGGGNQPHRAPRQIHPGEAASSGTSRLRGAERRGRSACRFALPRQRKRQANRPDLSDGGGIKPAAPPWGDASGTCVAVRIVRQSQAEQFEILVEVSQDGVQALRLASEPAAAASHSPTCTNFRRICRSALAADSGRQTPASAGVPTANSSTSGLRAGTLTGAGTRRRSVHGRPFTRR